jgi:hypothetical protein
MMARMSGKLVEMAERAEAHQGSLAEKLARAPLSLGEALCCATEIAAALRDLHRQGLAYGAVSSQLIEVGREGATLRPTGALKRLGDGRSDVAAFGAVLDEMLRRAETAGGRLDTLREQAGALAWRCSNESPAMQQVFITLRLLVFEARQCGARVRPAGRQAVALPIPAEAEPVEAPWPHIRARVRLALHWRPLAGLAAACARAAAR